jgi:hypothetical protein
MGEIRRVLVAAERVLDVKEQVCEEGMLKRE